MSRYQNPEVFERLAMAYALGTLSGRARKRFEALQEQHFYLRATTEAYERQFASMVELLPEQAPPNRVWDKLEAELDLNLGTEQKAQEEKGSWLNSIFPWLSAGFASVFGAVATVMVLGLHQPAAYVAKLAPAKGVEVAALAVAAKDDMNISVAMLDSMPVKKGMVPTLWCFSSNQHEEPQRLGTLAMTEDGMGGTKLSMDMKTWKGLKEADTFAISYEPMGEAASSPMGELLYTGQLLASR